MKLICFIITALIVYKRTSNALDLKHTLLIPPDDVEIVDDSYTHRRSSYKFTSGEPVHVDPSSTNLVGLRISAPFIVSATFKSFTDENVCLFSILTDEHVVMTLCLTTVKNNSSRVILASDLYSPETSMTYLINESYKDTWMNLIVYVRADGTADLYVNGNKRPDTLKLTQSQSLKNGVLLTKDLKILLAYFSPNFKFKGLIEEISLYTNADDDSLVHICDELRVSPANSTHNSETNETNRTVLISGQKGIPSMPSYKGDRGDTGPKGDMGFIGPPGRPGMPGMKGDRGDTGPKGDMGYPGIPGMPGWKGDRSDKGPKGDMGFIGPPGRPGMPGMKGDRSDTGPKGEMGYPGIPGMPGRKGDRGDTGSKGDMGFMGPVGQPGMPGIKGDRGDTGLKGEMGLTGRPGPPGIPVMEGDQGYAGLKGDMGLMGYPGIPGKPGMKGDCGLPGLKGDKGLMGYPGIPGMPGMRGDRGLPGLKGDNGSEGQSGLPGMPGEKGDGGQPGPKGDNGSGGPSGPPGMPGYKGEKGYTGATGVFGREGDKGNQGLKGYDGAKGDKGDTGISGFPGQSGPRGFSGQPGYKGDKGENGYDGIPGRDGFPASFESILDAENAAVVEKLRGFKGETGQTGSKGAKGETVKGEVQGEPGKDGKKGEKGDRGTDGLDGLYGEKGDTGLVGPKGNWGPQGRDGNVGQKGVMGSSPEVDLSKGDKGDNGHVGDSGVPGAIGPQGAPGTCAIGPPGPPGQPGPPGESDLLPTTATTTTPFVPTTTADVKHTLLIPPVRAEIVDDSYTPGLLSYQFTSKKPAEVDLSRTDLVGLNLSDPLIVTAIFKSYIGKAFCLFSITQDEHTVMKLCVQPAGLNVTKVTLFTELYSPVDSISYLFNEVYKDKWIKIVLYVKDNTADLYVNCNKHPEKLTLLKNRDVLLTKNMKINLGLSYSGLFKFKGVIEDINLRTNVNDDTLLHVCNKARSIFTSEDQAKTNQKESRTQFPDHDLIKDLAECRKDITYIKEGMNDQIENITLQIRNETRQDIEELKSMNEYITGEFNRLLESVENITIEHKVTQNKVFELEKELYKIKNENHTQGDTDGFEFPELE